MSVDNSTPQEKPVTKREVCENTVYTELYAELRRYRDYEFTSSTWYSALLLAILGFLVASRFGDTAPRFALLLETSCAAKVLFVAVAALIAGTSTFLVWYSYARYQELRKYTTDNLEPKWKTTDFTPREHPIAPRHFYYATPWFVFLLILILTFTHAPKNDGSEKEPKDRQSVDVGSPKQDRTFNKRSDPAGR